MCTRVLAHRHWQEYEFIPIETLATCKLSALLLPQHTFIAAFFHMSTQAFSTEINILRRLKDSIALDAVHTRAALPCRRTYVSRPNPNQTLKVWPFVFIFIAGTGAYVYMVKNRASEPQKPRGPSVTPK